MCSYGLKVLVASLTLLFTTKSVFSQNEDLLGVIDDKLVRINHLNGQMTVLKSIQGFPNGENIADLTYNYNNKLYYSVQRISGLLHLISISIDGDYQVIGPLNISGIQIALCEAMAYNRVDNKLYASVSLNGGISNNDFYSESIVEVDPSTGECVFVTEVSTNHFNADIDIMVFEGNMLYMFDGAPPSSNFLSFYVLDLSGVNPLSVPQLIYSSSYLPITGFSVINQHIYFTENRNLRRYSISDGTMHFVGAMHSLSEFNGNTVTAMSKVVDCTLPQIELGEDITLCSGQAIMLDASFPDTNFTWQDSSTAPIYQVTQTGTFWVRAENSCGATSDTVRVVFEELPRVDLGPDSVICEGTNIILSAVFPGATYIWKDGSSNPSYQVTHSDTYWVEVENSCGTDQDTVSIIMEGLPAIELGSDRTLCKGTQLILDATYPNATNSWQNGDTSPKFTVTSPGTYWVKTAARCGVTSDTVRILYEGPPMIDLGADRTLCNNSGVVLDAFFSGAKYSWQNGSVSSTFKADTSGTYWVEVENSCGIRSDTVQLIFENIPEIELGEDRTICNRENVRLDATFQNSTYTWYDGSNDPVFEVNESGIYWVQVKNSCGITQDTVKLTFPPKKDELFIPNIFTPNGDEFNELFEVDSSLLGSSIKVFQRNGKEVYRSLNYHNDWDGDDLLTGVYFYQIIDNCGSYYKGTVTILY